MRLKTLKPRVQTIGPGVRLAATNGESWRAGKTSSERGYDYRWQKERAAFLRENPLCAYCLRDGQVTAATVVDHKVPHRGDQSLFWDRSNWQSLCAPHHDGEKAKEERSQGLR